MNDNSPLKDTAQGMKSLGSVHPPIHGWWAVGEAMLAVLDTYPEAAKLAEEIYNTRTKEK